MAQLINRNLHFLIPDVVDAGRSKAELVTHNSEKEEYFKELETLTRDMAFVPILHKLLLSNMHAIMDSIPRGELIFNLCDGSDVDGVPALYLESKNTPGVIGCDSLFINNTLTKNGMKELFQKHLVSNPPGFPVTRETDLPAQVEAHGMMYPLFVKISDSYGSVGLDDTSVCHTEEQLLKKCQSLFLEFDNLTVEEFIDGQEFSVLIQGNSRDPNQSVIVYPPAERAFNKNLERYQRFISFDRNWDESLLAHSYEKVEDPDDAMALQDLARRAYFAVSGICYGRVDIRKRDVSGKFYVLEVNASCGLGRGTSSDFILTLAGQTTPDFFKILLSSSLAVPLLPTVNGTPPELIPDSVKEKVSKLIHHPSLATVPTPVVHVIVSAVLVDTESSVVPDPEGKLSNTYGKDAEYVSELETIFRHIGLDPIVHLFHVDPLKKVLETLDKTTDLVFNACLGSDGYAVASLLQEMGLQRTVGLNAQFFKQSASRPVTRDLLSSAKIRMPRGILLPFQYDQNKNMEERLKATKTLILNHMKTAAIHFPIYLKPGQAFRHQEGQHSGRAIASEVQLSNFLFELFSSESKGDEVWILEELAVGSEFRVLVAGDGRDPNRDVIVLPPIKYNPTAGSIASVASDPVFGSTRSLLLRKESTHKIDKDCASEVSRRYSRMRDSELMLQMDIQDLARRSYCAVHGSCYGLVHVVNLADGTGLVVLGVHGDVRFGDNAKASIVMQLAGLNMLDLFQWLLQRV